MSSNSGGTADLIVRPERIRLGRAFFIASLFKNTWETGTNIETSFHIFGID